MSKNIKSSSAKNMRINKFQAIIILLITAVVLAIFTILRPTFLSYDNLHSILLTAVPVGLIAIGECVCIMGGFFDLSVGMVASLSSLCAAFMLKSGQGVVVGLLVGWLVGLACGGIAGLAVSRLKMNAFITTYALQQIYRGIIYIWTKGFSNVLMSEEYAAFTSIGQSKMFNDALQMPIVVMIVIYVLAILFMKFTRVGRSVYLIGNNTKAADICGINVKNVQLFTFMLSGFLAATAGMLLASRTAVSAPFVGETYALEAITAAIVGGTSMAGGKGSLTTTFVGVFIIYVIKNGLIMVGVPDFYQYIAIGVTLFLAVLAQTQRDKK